MTPELLIAEGRRLAKPCVFLRPEGVGSVAAVWHDADAQEMEKSGFRCWMTVDARYVPNLSDNDTGFISVFTNEEDCVGGRIEVNSAWPNRRGVPLYWTEEIV